MYKRYLQKQQQPVLTRSKDLVFIPRDSGFFSVFNYLLGMIHAGYQVYPYWNYEITKQTNPQMRHFSYLDKNIENCWFEYFEPIKYSEDDEKNYDCKVFIKTQGYETPADFKYIEFRQSFLKKPDDAWRKKVHKTYAKHIRPSKKTKELLITIPEDTIGVHYRHPSHMCEQGEVYFRNYFDYIDKLPKESKIFLATDNDLGIIVFKHRYGDRIFYRDIKRTPVDNILEWANALTRNKPDNLGFVKEKGFQIHYDADGSVELGFDVLVDALCLARCRYLVHSISNVAFTVSYMNPDITMMCCHKDT